MLARIRKTTTDLPYHRPADHRARFGIVAPPRLLPEGEHGTGDTGSGDGKGTGDTSGDGTGDTGSGDTGGDGKGGNDTGSGDGDKKFDQAHLDRVISERLAAERKKFDRELEAEREKAGKTAQERAELDKQRAEQERDEARQALVTERVNGKARDAALEAKANPERIAAILRLADLTGCADDAGNVDEGKVAKAVKTVLDDFPEFRAQTKAGKSGGELNGGGKADPTLDDFRKMDYAERTKLYRENVELYEKLQEQLNNEG